MKNNKMLYVILFLLFGIFIIAFLINKGSYSVSSDGVYTRKQLQDMVVSTAVSYYYNNTYTDYEQYAMDDYATFNWRNFNNSPEMISRSNVSNFDCSSFVSDVYLYSLGYDDSDYTAIKANNDDNKYNIGGSFKTYNSQNKLSIYYSVGSKNYFQNNYLQCGKSQGSDIGRFINRNILANKSEYLTSGNEWKYYLNETGNNSFDERLDNVIFYYEVPLKENGLNAKVENLLLSNDDFIIEEETEEGSGVASGEDEDNANCNAEWYADCSEQETIKRVIRDTLQPGDRIHIWRVNQDGTKTKGHIMLYVGDALNKNGGRGFIHSRGRDFAINSDGTINIGDNKYNNSIRYDTWKYFMDEYLFRNEVVNGEVNNNLTFSISITRPINEYCTDDTHCSLTKNDVRSRKYQDNYDLYLSNTNTRVDMQNLQVEQFQYKGTDTKNVINKYNSVNVGDTISYSILLKNKSIFGYCQSGKYDNKADCIAASLYSWSNGKCTDNISETKEACLATKLKWIESTRDAIDYNNLVVSAKIPEGTEYVANSCRYQIHTDGGTNVTGTDACTYNATTRIITWNKANISSDDENYHSFTYKVKPSGNINNIVKNDGMVVTLENGNSLKLGELVTYVNPTINGNNIQKLQDAVDARINNTDTEKYNYTDALAFVTDIYSEVFDIDLNDYLNSYSFSYRNIRDAIFKPITDDEKLTVDDYSDNITNDTRFVKRLLFNNNQKLIYNMLVPGVYGGRHLIANVGLDRARILFNKGFKSTLEVGDIIILYDFDDNTNNYYTYLFYGYENNDPIFVRFRNGNYTKYDATTSKTGYQLYKEIYAYDLFLTLRPSRILNTDIDAEDKVYITNNNTYTINYNMNGATKDNSLPTIGYVYDNIVIPYLDNKIVTWTFDASETGATISSDSLTFEQSFTGWSSNSNNGLSSDALIYSARVNDYITWDGTLSKQMYFSNLANQGDAVTMVANWKNVVDTVTMPTIDKPGYTCYWQSQNGKVTAESGEKRTPVVSASTTYKWYAVCNAKTYTITFDGNGGIGNMDNLLVQRDLESILPENTFVRDGYTFVGWVTNLDNTTVDFYDKGKIYNITNEETVTLYAKWLSNSFELNVSDDLDKNDEYLIIKNVPLNTSVNALKEKIFSPLNLKFVDEDNNEIMDRNVRTGDFVVISDGNEEIYYTILVKNDVNSDDVVDKKDAIVLAKYIIDGVRTEHIPFTNLLAGDMNNDGKIKMNDVMQLLRTL